MDSHFDRCLGTIDEIEAMAGYPGSLRVTRPLVDVNLAQLQGKISMLTEKNSRVDDPKSDPGA
jgi:hypothetical protein